MYNRVAMLQVKPFDYEHSEMLLYQNVVMREAGMTEDALKHFDTYDTQIVDRMCFKEINGTTRAWGTWMSSIL